MHVTHRKRFISRDLVALAARSPQELAALSEQHYHDQIESIADEVLAVGDFLFQQKCEKRMKELMAGGTTVILVSHSIEQIERMCSKVAWLSHGHLKMNGDTETVCNAYKAVQRGEA